MKSIKKTACHNQLSFNLYFVSLQALKECAQLRAKTKSLEDKFSSLEIEKAKVCTHVRE